MPASWTFDLVDVNGVPLTDGGFHTYNDLLMTFQRGAPAVLTCTIPLTHHTAQTIASSNEADYYLKGYWQPEGGTAADRILKLYAPVWVDEVVGQNGADVVSIVAADPMIILGKRFTSAQFTPQDLGAIAKSMVDTTNTTDGETGIQTSASYVTTSSSTDLDLRENKPSILSLLEQFDGQLDGATTWIVPQELSGGKIGQLWVAPRRGGETTAIFAYGPGTLANCSAMRRSRDKGKIENTIVAYSDTLTTTKTDATSVAALRNLVAYYSATGETSSTQLGALAQGRLDARGTKASVAEYACTPTQAAPELFTEFDIDDDVCLHFRKGLEFYVQQRVVSATIRVKDGLQFPEQVEFRRYE